jgi:hypothetical protein
MCCTLIQWFAEQGCSCAASDSMIRPSVLTQPSATSFSDISAAFTCVTELSGSFHSVCWVLLLPLCTTSIATSGDTCVSHLG